MRALICGSVAYDSIMVFKDRFKNHILPDKVHMISVSFLVPEMRKEFGGCAGNMAYSARLLGIDAMPMATVGKDFQRYGKWMDACGVPRRHISTVDNEFTAQAFITTDMDDNQITAFHPGAMDYSHLNDVRDTEGVSIGVVSPDGREGMIRHAEQFTEMGIPFVFDPSQGLPMFDGEHLERFLEQATWLTVNDYEWEMVMSKTGRSLAEICQRLDAVIITKGSQGSVIHAKGKVYEIPPATPTQHIDPTGAGDAYRVGLLYGLMHGMDWENTGRCASLMGCLAIEKHGTQNHSFTADHFKERFVESFGRKLD